MRRLVPGPVARATESGLDGATINGAVLLFDAERSTRLSAQLADHGTIGAEALAEALTAVFTPIVDGVHRRAGFVAQFTGDGVMAIFPGGAEEATRAAVDAAQAISATLLATPPTATVAGDTTVTLRSIVGAGSIEWSIWSTDTPGVVQWRAFAYAGTALDEVLRGEPLVGGGSIAVGPRAATFLPELRGAVLPEGYVVLDRPVAASPQSPPPPDVTDGGGDPNGFYPDMVTASDIRGEFRDVINVFATLKEDADEPQRAAVLDLVGTFGGYLCDIVRAHADDSGPTLFAMWGAPQTSEDDIARAVRFALALREVVGVDAIRAGLAVGDAYAGFVGTDTRAAYTTVGSVVNLAARMCAAAAWGEIRIGRRIARRLPPTFETTLLGELEYRGFTEPITSLAVTGERAGAKTTKRLRPLRGRSDELEALAGALAPLTRGRSPGIVAVSGEAGAGKSHLIDAARDNLSARLPSTSWVRTWATEVTRGPFEPIRRLLLERFGADATSRRFDAAVRRLAQRHPDHAAALDRGRRTLLEFVGLTDRSPDTGVDPDVRFARILEAVGDLLRSEGLEHPLVLEIRDGHWLDASSLEFLDRLATDLTDTPVAFLVETRSAAPGEATTIDVPALDRPTMTAVIEDFLAETPSDGLVDLVFGRSGGNPFFARQLIRYMQEEELLDQGDDGLVAQEGAARIPDDLRRVVIARLDRLTGDVRRAVMTAAVLGREFDIRVLSAMLDDRPVDVSLREAVDAGIWSLVDEIRCLFHSLLVRDTAYGMQLLTEQRRLHGIAADAMVVLYGDALDEHTADVALHLERARRPREAAHHYRAAADRAGAVYANAQALGYLERITGLLPREDPLRFDALMSIEALHDRTGERESQRSVLDELEGLTAPGPDAKATLARRRVEWLIATGSYREAQTAVDAEVADATAHGRLGDLARAMLQRARIHRHLGQAAESETAAREAAVILEEAGDERGLATVDDVLGGLAWERGDFATSIARHRAAAERHRRSGHIQAEISALNNLGSALFGSGDYAAAREIHTRGIERSREIGYRQAEGDHLDNRGGTAWAVGDYAAAVADYEAALAIRRRMNDTWGIAISLGNLGATRRVMGETDTAARMYHEALQVDRDTGRRRGVAYSLHGLGLVHRDIGELDAAVTCLEEAIAIRSDLGETHLANESKAALADVLRRKGDLRTAAAVADEALQSEGDERFSGAVETTVALMNCYRVLAETDRERATSLLAVIRTAMVERSTRISDPAQRDSYLRAVSGHAEVLNLSE